MLAKFRNYMIGVLTLHCIVQIFYQGLSTNVNYQVRNRSGIQPTTRHNDFGLFFNAVPARSTENAAFTETELHRVDSTHNTTSSEANLQPVNKRTDKAFFSPAERNLYTSGEQLNQVLLASNTTDSDYPERSKKIETAATGVSNEENVSLREESNDTNDTVPKLQEQPLEGNLRNATGVPQLNETKTSGTNGEINVTVQPDRNIPTQSFRVIHNESASTINPDMIFNSSEVNVSNSLPSPSQFCYANLSAVPVQQVCHMECDKGYFSLPSMPYCHPWLTCHHLNGIKLQSKPFAASYVKKLYKAEWRNHTIVVGKLTKKSWGSLFRNGIRNFKALSHHGDHRITNYIGSCNETFIFLEFYPLGSGHSRDWQKLPLLQQLSDMATTNNDTAFIPPRLHDRLYGPNVSVSSVLLHIKFKFCLDIAQYLVFLHNSPMGPVVMADTDAKGKTLSQFLIREDLTLIGNDLDMLPQNGSQQPCRAPNLAPFIAPEQVCPKRNRKYHYVNLQMTTASDVWKFPYLCSHFVGSNRTETGYSDRFSNDLRKIFHDCHKQKPKERPSSNELLRRLEDIIDKI